MIYEFRLAQAKDFYAVASIFKRAVEKMNSQAIFQWDELYPNEEMLQSDIDSRQMYVLTDNRTIVSAVVVNEEQSPEYRPIHWKCTEGRIAVIHRLCVDPDFQHDGIGKKTMAYVEEMLIKKGYSSIRLDAFSQNHYALRMYEKLGYLQRGEVMFRKGLFYLYEKRLTVMH